MNATFTQAGVSRLKGEFKFRVANDALRVKVLAKNGHTDIDLIELPTPMTKEAAVSYLLEINFDNGNTEVRAALEAEKEKRTEKPKAEKKPRAKKEKVSMESIKAKIAEAQGATKAVADEGGADVVEAESATAEGASIQDTAEDTALEDAPY